MPLNQQKVPLAIAGFLIGFITVALLLPKPPTLRALLMSLAAGLLGGLTALAIASKPLPTSATSYWGDTAPERLRWLFPVRRVEGSFVIYTETHGRRVIGLCLVALFLIIPKSAYLIGGAVTLLFVLLTSYQMLDDLHRAKERFFRPGMGGNKETWCRFGDV